MTIAVVLRLVEKALAVGRLAGEAEIVGTGERRTVRDAAELVEFLREPEAGEGASVARAPTRSCNDEGRRP